MKRLALSLQRVAFFLSMLACRCANASNSRPQRQPVLESARPAISLLLLPLAFSCATAISGTRESLAVDSNPRGADVTLTCSGTRADSGVTPTTLRFRRNAGDCTLKASKEGYATASTLIEKVSIRRIGGTFSRRRSLSSR